MNRFSNTQSSTVMNLPICQLANLPIRKYSNWIILLLSLIFLLSENSFSQEIEWQKTIGGSENEFINSIQQTTDGGYVLGGFSDSDISGHKTENSLGGYDYWIVKTDSLGNIQWENTIGGSSTDELYSIQQTTDGGYILGGWSSSNISGDKTENSLGIYDYWIVKVDSIGSIQWQNTIGGASDDRLYSMQQTADGGYILGGTSDSNISGDKTENSNGVYDYWIVKIDSLGTIQWQNTIGGSDWDQFNSIQQTTDGGYILAGSSNSGVTGDKTDNCFGLYFDYWIVKVDSLGIIQWQNTIGGSGIDELYSIQQTADGGYILGGYSDSHISGNKTENSIGNSYDYWIVKLNSLGLIEWQNTIGGSGLDYLSSIRQTTNGGYIMVGSSNSNISGDKTEKYIGFSDYWIVRTDSLGNIIWQNTIGGSDFDDLICIQQTNDGSYILGGISMSNISGDKIEKSYGEVDIWINKVTANINYVSGKVFIDHNSNGLQDIGELSLSGQLITLQGAGRFAFSQPNGEYIVSVLDTGSYTLSPQTLPYYSPNPLTHSAIFSGIYQTDSLNDFAFQPLGTHEDVWIKLTPLGAFRSGFAAWYRIDYGNIGTTTVSPTVTFYHPSSISFDSASVSPSLVSSDSVTWSLPALTPFQSGSIWVRVNVSLGLPIGTLINSSSYIEPYFTDDYQPNNNSGWEVFITGSFDPNDILVDKAILTTTQLSTNPWLEYIIRFQNTGNDTAFTVKILNPIDARKLKSHSIDFLNASHPVTINWINHERNLEFKFENILLPDSNTNEAMSHGFVRYRIRPKTNLNAGDSIPNFAAIYFDFNEPIITNTAKTNIVLPTGLAGTNTSPGKLLVFPNPAENSITVSGVPLENGKAQVRLMDIYGKLILEKTVSEVNSIIEVDKLANGVYLIESGARRATFVKQ